MSFEIKYVTRVPWKLTIEKYKIKIKHFNNYIYNTKCINKCLQRQCFITAFLNLYTLAPIFEKNNRNT